MKVDNDSSASYYEGMIVKTISSPSHLKKSSMKRSVIIVVERVTSVTMSVLVDSLLVLFTDITVTTRLHRMK